VADSTRSESAGEALFKTGGWRAVDLLSPIGAGHSGDSATAVAPVTTTVPHSRRPPSRAAATPSCTAVPAVSSAASWASCASWAFSSHVEAGVVAASSGRAIYAQSWRRVVPAPQHSNALSGVTLGSEEQRAMPTGDPGTGGGGASAAGAAGHTPLASAYHAFVTRPWTMRKMADEFAQLLGMAPAGVDGGNLAFRTGIPALHPLDLERPLRPGSFRLDGRHLRHRPPRPDEQLRSE
jgi:hypothetical protein